MALTDDEVRKVARLSRLEIEETAVSTLRDQLHAVLDYVQELQSLDLRDVEPMAHVGDSSNRLDDDHPGPTLGADQVTTLAPEAAGPFIKVPRVLGGGSA